MNYPIYNQRIGPELKDIDRPYLRAYARKYTEALLKQFGLSYVDLKPFFMRVLVDNTWEESSTVSTNVNRQTISDLRRIYTHSWSVTPELAESIDAGMADQVGTSSVLNTTKYTIKDGIISMATSASSSILGDAPDTDEVTADMSAAASSTNNTSSVADVKFKPEFTDALNSLLNLSSGGAIPDIKTLMSSVNDVVRQKRDADITIKQMKAELGRKAVSFESKEFTVNAAAGGGNIPAGKFKTALAKDIFTDPSGKRADVLNFEVPVFEWDHDHPEVPNIDPNYIFNPESLISFLYGLVSNKNTWLHGHTGTGKTTFVEQVAARLQWPVIRVNLDNDIERSDFLGQTQLVTGASGVTESKFVEGVLPRAMQSPSIFLIDEMDFGKSGIMYVLQRALEAKGLLITEDGGRLIEPHPLFRMVATANTRGQGDELGCYPGARTQSNALLDRFTVWINVDYMDSKQEALLLKRMFPDTDEAFITQLVTFSKEIRKAFVNRELLQSISPRSLMTICDSRGFYSALTDSDKATKLAIKSSYLQRATEDTVAKVNEISARCFSSAKATTA